MSTIPVTVKGVAGHTVAEASRSAIEAVGVVRRYANGSGVGPIDLHLPMGQVLGLVGANGAGKTTLLRILTGLTAPDEGSLRVLGAPVRLGAAPDGIGAVIEEPAFYPWATATQNLAAAAAGRPARVDRIPALLEEVGLQAVAHEQVRTFSQGMRQRLGLARALLGDPRLLILDEPTNGLDPHGIRWLRGLIRSRAEAGGSAIVSSHMLAEMRLLADVVVVVVEGVTVATFATADLGTAAGALEDAYFRLLS